MTLSLPCLPPPLAMHDKAGLIGYTQAQITPVVPRAAPGCFFGGRIAMSKTVTIGLSLAVGVAVFGLAANSRFVNSAGGKVQTGSAHVARHPSARCRLLRMSPARRPGAELATGSRHAAGPLKMDLWRCPAAFLPRAQPGVPGGGELPNIKEARPCCPTSFDVSVPRSPGLPWRNAGATPPDRAGRARTRRKGMEARRSPHRGRCAWEHARIVVVDASGKIIEEWTQRDRSLQVPHAICISPYGSAEACAGPGRPHPCDLQIHQ